MSESAAFYLEDRLRKNMPEVLLTRVFMPQEQHACLSAQFVLLDEMSELCRIRETGVAMTKMAWWFEEWKRLGAGEPRHPVTKTLLGNSNVKGHSWPSLDGMLSVVASIIQGNTPADVSELKSWLTDFSEPLAVLEPGNPGSLNNLSPTWRKVVLLNWISTLSRLAELGRAPWPLDLSARSQIRRAQLRDTPIQQEAAVALWSLMSDESDPVQDSNAGHAGIYLSVAKTTVLARALGQTPAGRWQSLFTAWKARRRC